MTLQERINADLISALKNREEKRLSILRLLKTEIKNQEIEKRFPLTNEEIIQAIRRMIKHLQEATLEFSRGGRLDLAAKNTEEANVLQLYLPPSLSDEELKRVVEEAIAEAQAAGLKDFGPVMGLVMKKLGGKVEGSKVKELVNKILRESPKT